ncbi:two component transcriptional regulator, LuxR family [Ekhidna lutea]|uniref:Two component transcriptional regulator, LuxR family n=1 Tax=Ekhidna lutea TaxID=447679 RepID=A0A239KMK5_EKHLU|nr:response regulator transcription factor [Ekhidna lutea]SNT18853.1 two component transcriptional regulator, LuxR family [Ekhidna lutea]
MQKKIHIGLVEDQHLFREGLKSLLSSWEDFEVVMESEDGFSVMDKLDKSSPKPDVLLLDLSLPQKDGEDFDGIAVTDAVLEIYPDIKILILSVHNDDGFIAELIERGAHGYLVKDSDPDEVREAILSVYSKGSYINQRALLAIQKRMNHRGKKPSFHKGGEIPLTKREVEVLQLVCQQMTTGEIAEKLFISMKTVDGHRNNLLQKTHSRNVAGLVLYALKNNLIEVG